MRVLLADMNQEVRSALNVLLQESVGPQLVDEAGNDEELRKQSENAPDLLILDWGLAAGEVFRSGPRPRPGDPSTRLIVLSSNPEDRQDALRSGADYFISKAEPPERLLQILHDIQSDRQAKKPS